MKSSIGFAAVVMMLLDFAGDGGASSDGGASCDGGVSNDGGASSDGGACFHGAKRWTASAPSPHALAGCVLAAGCVLCTAHDARLHRTMQFFTSPVVGPNALTYSFQVLPSLSCCVVSCSCSTRVSHFVYRVRHLELGVFFNV